MKFLTPLAALALTACGPLAMMAGIPAAPAAVANRSTLDEQAALSVELAYQASVTAIRFANRTGALSAENKQRAADLDNQAYRAVLAVRSAYDAGNATSYGAASAKAQAAVRDLLALIGG